MIAIYLLSILPSQTQTVLAISKYCLDPLVQWAYYLAFNNQTKKLTIGYVCIDLVLNLQYGTIILIHMFGLPIINDVA